MKVFFFLKEKIKTIILLKRNPKNWFSKEKPTLLLILFFLKLF